MRRLLAIVLIGLLLGAPAVVAQAPQKKLLPTALAMRKVNASA